MIRENNHQLNKTITYAYDLGGNLTVEKEYAFTTAETFPDTPVKTMTETYDSAWKDKLLSWDGTAMTYDAIEICLPEEEQLIPGHRDAGFPV